MLRDAVRRLRFGSVEVVVHDGRVVQVETREKVRFADHRLPDSRRRQDAQPGEPDRKAGGAAPSGKEPNE
ncbi:MAG TPA: YezD family protein [Vicinamibacteria bacterium]|nr:YezD family protein [Vicinamibacteria bacterium]